MRVTAEQLKIIKTLVHQYFGDDAGLWLFGSRVDDSKRGGDIDLLICPGPDGSDQLFDRKIRLLTKLEQALGERKIDVIVETPSDTRPIVAVARATGVKIR